MKELIIKTYYLSHLWGEYTWLSHPIYHYLFQCKINQLSQDLVAAIVAKVSPNWVKKAPNKVNSSADLSWAIAQAREEIKVTNSQDPKTNTSIYYMKKRFSQWLKSL